jgi:hypothetical protein
VTLLVPPENESPGCGRPGAIIHFEIDGRPANQSLTWAPGAGTFLTFTAGPEAAVYWGEAGFDRLPVNWHVVPVIDGMECGWQLNGFRGEGPTWTYEVAVYPDEMVPGCGRDRALITLRVIQTDQSGAKRVIGDLEGAQISWAPGAKTHLPDATLDASGSSE